MSSMRGDGRVSCDEKLADVLESCTRELVVICGGLEFQQLEAQDTSSEGSEVKADTLSSLEEMTDECAALLACLEDADQSRANEFRNECETPELLNATVDEQEQEPQQEENVATLPRQQNLAHELDTFADELQELMSRLENGDHEEYTDEVRLPSPHHVDEAKCQSIEDAKSLSSDNCTEEMGLSNNVPGSAAEEATPSDNKAVFNQRTKQAVALHVKRLKLCRCGSRLRSSAKAKAPAHVQEKSVANSNVVWSKFQNSSFQRHIKRQQHARLRTRQTQAALDQLEASRVRGTAVRSALHDPSMDENRVHTSDSSHKTYLDHFRSTSARASSSSEIEPRFLCAVYLYGLRRLGTTYITFNSLAQLQQRVRARFSIDAVVSVYREVNDGSISTVVDRGPQRRHNKRLHRVSTLGQVHDGDTLCVTRDAYDDMTILCEWITRRQHVVHSFQHQVQQTAESTLSQGATTPPKTKFYSAKPQLWDSNGRSVGVKTQLSILPEGFWESSVQQ